MTHKIGWDLRKEKKGFNNGLDTICLCVILICNVFLICLVVKVLKCVLVSSSLVDSLAGGSTAKWYSPFSCNTWGYEDSRWWRTFGMEPSMGHCLQTFLLDISHCTSWRTRKSPCRLTGQPSSKTFAGAFTELLHILCTIIMFAIFFHKWMYLMIGRHSKYLNKWQILFVFPSTVHDKYELITADSFCILWRCSLVAACSQVENILVNEWVLYFF